MNTPDTASDVIETGYKDEHRPPQTDYSEALGGAQTVDIFEQIPDSAAQSSVPTWHPTASQRRGLNQLHGLADVFHKIGDGKLGGFQPACRRALLVGTSGCGKSAVACQFAAQRDVPIYSIDGGSWVIVGSQKSGTLRGVRDFVRSCDDHAANEISRSRDGQSSSGLQGIIWIDEVDKLLPTQEALSQTAWSLSVAAEAIALADSDSRLVGHEWSPRDIQRFRQNFILLAGGAFMGALAQVRRDSKKGSLGFGDVAEQTTYTNKISEYLPEELLSRFSSVVILEAPTRDDLAEAITRIHAELGLRRARPMDELLAEAESAQGAMRWLEVYLCGLILANPFVVRSMTGSRQKANPIPKEGRTYDLLVGDIPRCIAGANETIARLQIRLAVIYSQLHAISNQARQTPWNGMFNNPELGESLIRALRVCQLLTTVTTDDREEISALAQWRTVAWQTLTQNATDLAVYNLTEALAEAWALSGALIEYRASLSRAVQRGLLG